MFTPELKKTVMELIQTGHIELVTNPEGKNKICWDSFAEDRLHYLIPLTDIPDYTGGFVPAWATFSNELEENFDNFLTSIKKIRKGSFWIELRSSGSTGGMATHETRSFQILIREIMDVETASYLHVDGFLNEKNELILEIERRGSNNKVIRTHFEIKKGE